MEKSRNKRSGFFIFWGGNYPERISIWLVIRLFLYEAFGVARCRYVEVSGREVEIRTDMPDPSLARAD